MKSGERVNGKSVLEVRNKIHAGENLEVFRPDGSMSTITLPQPLITSEGEKTDFANNSQFVLLGEELEENAIIRRVNTNAE